MPQLTNLAARLPDLVEGDRLVHTDLHGEQFLIGADGATRVVDWSFPAAGAAWVDTAFLVLRLIEAGHSAADAEAWALTFFDIDPAKLTAFAAYVAGMWSYWTITDAAPGSNHRARLARDYVAWRLAHVAA